MALTQPVRVPWVTNTRRGIMIRQSVIFDEIFQLNGFAAQPSFAVADSPPGPVKCLFRDDSLSRRASSRGSVMTSQHPGGDGLAAELCQAT